MYSTHPGVIYGFHGIDKDIALKILNGEEDFIPSGNKYDWLGSGIYFWENNAERAEQWAIQIKKRGGSSIKTPFVLGAIIELGNCLDLLDQSNNDYLRDVYGYLESEFDERGEKLPKNEPLGKRDFDFKGRYLDCAVIEYARKSSEKMNMPFDTVRAAFIEGEPVYEGARFFTHSHIQVAVINPKCIKGVFLPR